MNFQETEALCMIIDDLRQCQVLGNLTDIMAGQETLTVS